VNQYGEVSLSSLIKKIEEQFLCILGEQVAYFQTPIDTRGVYQVVSFGALLNGGLPPELIASKLINILGETFQVMRLEGARRIVWRLGWRVDLSTRHICALGGDILEICTRFAAFTEDWKPISVPPWFPGNEIGRLLSREQLEDGSLHGFSSSNFSTATA
jgi:hypothetical protein